jgi:fatty acid desaturase
VTVVDAPGRRPNELIHTYTTLAREVRARGLIERARWFYGLLFGGLMLGLGAVITGMVLLGHSWFQLLMAGALGILLTQLAFLGHEASHRQVMKSGVANDRVGWILAVGFVGISYSWWMNKHTRHHANPNKIGKDPDIEIDTVSFTRADAASRRGPMAWFTRRQGSFFFPLLILEGINLHAKSVQSLWRGRRDRAQRVELAALVLRFVLYLAAVFWMLPLGMAFAFLGVQLAVFGFYLGSTFAPNHIGMAEVPADVKLDFFSKQVTTSRNVSGGWWMTALMGGLNYQIEHHLFPNMPRPRLASVRRLVQEHCRANDVPYTQTNLLAAWKIVHQHLDQVGLAAENTFRCPIATSLR